MMPSISPGGGGAGIGLALSKIMYRMTLSFID
jgi:hypothetical protein